MALTQSDLGREHSTPQEQSARQPPDSQPEATTINLPMNVRNAALSVLTVLAIIAALRFAQEVLIPIVLSIFIGYALDPVVTVVTKLRIPRWLAAGVVLVGLLTALIGTAYSLRRQALAVLDDLPVAARRLREIVQSKRAGVGPMDKVQKAATEIEKTASVAAGAPSPPRGVARVQIEEPTFRANDYLLWGSVGVLIWLGHAVLIFFMVYFLLASGDLYKRKLVKLAGPTLSQKKLSLQILGEIDGQIERFLLVQVVTSLLVAVLTGLALWALGVNQPAVWGIAAGVLNSIPYFGAIMVSVGLALVAFLQFGTFTMAAYVSGVAFVITSLEGFLLTPALMGRAARINQVALFVSILFWSWMWGVLGMILAVPIMMVIKSICDRVEGLWRISELLGERTAPRTDATS